MSELYRIASARNTAKDEMRMRGEEAAAAREFQASENLAMREFQKGRDKINAQLRLDIAQFGRDQAIELARERTLQLKNALTAQEEQARLGRELEREKLVAEFGGYTNVPMGPPSADGTMGTVRQWQPGFHERMADKKVGLFKSLVEMGTPDYDTSEDPSTIEINIPAHIVKDFNDAGIDMPSSVMAGDLPYYIDQLQPDALDYFGRAATIGAGPIGVTADALGLTDYKQKEKIREGRGLQRLNELMTLVERESKRRGEQFTHDQKMSMISAFAPMVMGQ